MTGFDISNPSNQPSDLELTQRLMGRLIESPIGLVSCVVRPSLLEFRGYRNHGLKIIRIHTIGSVADWIVSVSYQSTEQSSLAPDGISLNELSRWIALAHDVKSEKPKPVVSSSNDTSGAFSSLENLVESIEGKEKEVSDATEVATKREEQQCLYECPLPPV